MGDGGSGIFRNGGLFLNGGGLNSSANYGKYSILFDKSYKGYMEKDTNCLTVKTYHESKISFYFLRCSF